MPALSIGTGRLPRFYYGWIVVGVVSVMPVLGGGLHGYGLTLLTALLIKPWSVQVAAQSAGAPQSSSLS